MRQITQQESESAIFGSGFDCHSWWREIQEIGGWERDGDHYAPEGWAYLVTVENPQSPGVSTVTVTHSVIRAAVRKIAENRAGEFPTREAKQECWNFFFSPDSLDLDASAADQVMQVATLGGVFYG